MQVKIIAGHKIVVFYKVENIKRKKILAADSNWFKAIHLHVCGTQGHI